MAIRPPNNQKNAIPTRRGWIHPTTGELLVGGSISQKNIEVFIVALKNIASKDIERYPHIWVRMGQIGKAIQALKENNCEELILIGGVKKPNIWLLKPDFGALKLFFKLVMLQSKGDAAILKTLLKFLEIDNKFKVVGAEKYIPHLLMSEGLLAGEKIDKQTQIDIDIAIANCSNIGFKDIGQACVVVNREIIASEDASGTDNMLRNLVSKEIKFSKKGVLVKLAKPIQDKRVDLPVIGMQTIHLVKEIGLRGIAIENRSSFILEKEQVIKFASDNDIFIYGFNNECA